MTHTPGPRKTDLEFNPNVANGPIIKYNATKLAATAIAQSVEQTKYYLNGVYFDGQTTIATDGHMLTISYDPDSRVDKNGIYPISKKARAAMKKKTAETVIIHADLLSVRDERDDTLFEEPCFEIDGTIPPYHRVIPRERGNATLASFSGTLIKRVCTTGDILNALSFLITGRSDTAPHIVSYRSQHDIFSVIMPYQGYDHCTALPEWYHDPSPADETEDDGFVIDTAVEKQDIA